MDTIYSGNQARFSTCTHKNCGKSNSSLLKLQLNCNCINFTQIVQIIVISGCSSKKSSAVMLHWIFFVCFWSLQIMKFDTAVLKANALVECTELAVCLKWCQRETSSFSSVVSPLLENWIFPVKISKQILSGWTCNELSLHTASSLDLHGAPFD